MDCAITPTTSEVTTKAPIDARSYQWVTVMADVLAGAETATLYVLANATFVPFKDSAGAAAQLTATNASMTLVGGNFYGIVKTATVGACGVFWEAGPAKRS